jgi:hypothetical protein
MEENNNQNEDLIQNPQMKEKTNDNNNQPDIDLRNGIGIFCFRRRHTGTQKGDKALKVQAS